MWYAVLSKTGEVIAEGESYRECSQKAFETGLWPSTELAAPYFLTSSKMLAGVE